jgi:phage shock protein PspC (stress-responsive transcriptional regulator)
MILGVSEWLSGKLDVKAKYIRIIFVLSVLLVGTGLGIYLILWIVKLLSK